MNNQVPQTLTAQLPEIAKSLNGIVLSVLGDAQVQLFEKAFLTASAIQQLDLALTAEYMQPIMFLQGSKLGFRTDKDSSGGYPQQVVKRCLIEAVLSGVQPAGNHFNIIAGNMYITKEGYGYLLANLPGLWYKITPTLPRIKDNSGAVVMSIEWQYNGTPGKQELDVPVKVNAGMGTDAVIGKATRKARHWLYTTLTGTEMPEGDVTDVDFKIVQEKAKPNHELERAISMIEATTTVEKLEALVSQFSDEIRVATELKVEQHRTFILSANGN